MPVDAMAALQQTQMIDCDRKKGSEEVHIKTQYHIISLSTSTVSVSHTVSDHYPVATGGSAAVAVMRTADSNQSVKHCMFAHRRHAELLQRSTAD